MNERPATECSRRHTWSDVDHDCI